MAEEKQVMAAKPLVLADTCDVTLEDLATGKIIMSAQAQLASISQTVDEQEIRGGIGGGLIATITSQKNIEATFRDALFSMDYVSMVSGVEYEDQEVEFLVQLKGRVNNEGKLVITDEEVATGIVTTEEGAQIEVAFDAGVASTELETIMPDAKEGDEITVAVKKTEKGKGVTIRADKFPQKFRLTYRTVGMDPTTLEHVNDILIQFYEVKPSGNFDLGFEMSTPITPEMTFNVTKPLGCNELGKIVAVKPNVSEVDC